MPVEIQATPDQAKAAEIRSAYNTKLTAIRSDGTLSAQGRADAIGRLWGTTAKQLADLKAVADASGAGRKSALEKELLGLRPAATTEDASSFRDAVGRVASVDSEDDAIDLLGYATLGSDAILAKVILAKAIQNRWVNAANEYIAANPILGPKVEELWDLSVAIARPGASIADWVFFPPEKPNELWNRSAEALIANA